MATKIIAVDPGKFGVKAIHKDNSGTLQKIYFRSKLRELGPQEAFETQGNSIFIGYDGRRFIYGDQGVEDDRSLTKETMLHKIGLMSAISKCIEHGDTVKLLLGCPASIYKSKEARTKYKDFMTDGGELKFDDAKRTYNVLISNTLVLPEAGGISALYSDYFKDSRVIVVDLGGLNMNCSVFNNMVLELDSLQTVNHGAFDIHKEIQVRFSAAFSRAFTREDVESIIQQGGLYYQGAILPESRTLLESIYMDFVEEIPNLILGLGYDISIMKVVFIGGTSAFLGERLKTIAPHAVISQDNMYANSLGFFKIGEAKFSDL